jgi:hypothetical protein
VNGIIDRENGDSKSRRRHLGKYWTSESIQGSGGSTVWDDQEAEQYCSTGAEGKSNERDAGMPNAIGREKKGRGNEGKTKYMENRKYKYQYK